MAIESPASVSELCVSEAFETKSVNWVSYREGIWGTQSGTTPSFFCKDSTAAPRVTCLQGAGTQSGSSSSVLLFLGRVGDQAKIHPAASRDSEQRKQDIASSNGGGWQMTLV